MTTIVNSKLGRAVSQREQEFSKLAGLLAQHLHRRPAFSVVRLRHVGNFHLQQLGHRRRSISCHPLPDQRVPRLVVPLRKTSSSDLDVCLPPQENPPLSRDGFPLLL